MFAFCNGPLQREEELEVLRAEFNDVKEAFREQLQSLMASEAAKYRMPQ